MSRSMPSPSPGRCTRPTSSDRATPAMPHLGAPRSAGQSSAPPPPDQILQPRHYPYQDQPQLPDSTTKGMVMSKVKVFAAFPRKAGLSRDEFHDHWRHPHATLGRRVPVVTKYVLSHQIDSDLLGDDQHRYDGIAEGWMDNVGDVIAFGQDPWYVNHVVPAEPNFMDQANLKSLVTTEIVLQSSPMRILPRPVGDEFWFDDDRAVNIKIIQFIETAPQTDW